MFSITAPQYFLYAEPTDMRMGFDGLSGLVSTRLGEDPRSGDLFIFLNRPRNCAKMLRWEPGGYVLFYKRLESGTFELPPVQHAGKKRSIEYGQLAMMVTGFSMKHARKRRRF
jgi:transposase